MASDLTATPKIRSRKGGWYLVRMRPYRTVEDKIDGVVLTPDLQNAVGEHLAAGATFSRSGRTCTELKPEGHLAQL